MRRLVAAFGLLAACNLPGRDNVHDPSSSPDFEVIVPVTSGGYSTELMISVRKNVAGESFAPNEVEMRLDLHDDDWDTEPVDDFEIAIGPSGDHVFTLPIRRDMVCPDPATPCGWTGAISRDVRVRVIARSGHYETRLVTFVLSNQAPIVDLGDDIVVAPSFTGAVTIDPCGGGLPFCSTRDPDGNPLTFIYERVSGPDVALGPIDAFGRRSFVLPPGTGSRPWTFRVTAADELAATSSEVRVFAEPQVWVATFAPSRLVRLLPSSWARTTIDGETVSARAAATDEASGVMWIADGDPTPSDLEFHRVDRNGRSLGKWTTPLSGIRDLVVTGASACAIASTGGSFAFGRFPGPGAIPILSTVDAGDETLGVEPHAGASHACWAIGTKNVYRLTAAGARTAAIPAPVTHTRLRAFGRATDGALWVMDYPSTGGTLIVRYPESGPAAVIGNLDFILRGLSRSPAGGMFSSRGGLSESLIHIDPSGTWTAASPDSVLLGEFQQVGRQMATDLDPTSPALWVSDMTRGTLSRYRIEPDGVTLTHERSLATDAFLPTTAGLLWQDLALDAGTGAVTTFLQPFGTPEGRFGRVTPALRAYDVLSSDLVLDEVVTDVASGTAWSAGSNVVHRLSADGRLLAKSSATDRQTTVAVSDAGEVWIATASTASTGSIFRVLSTGSAAGPAFATGFAIPIFLSISATTGCGLENAYPTGERHAFRFDAQGVVPFPQLFPGALDPYAAPDGTCWMFDRPSGGPCLSSSVRRFPPDSTTPLVITDAFGEAFRCSFKGTGDPRDGGYWLSTTTITGSRVVRFGPTGAEDYQILDLFAGNAFDVMQLCGDSGNHACIELWHDDLSDIVRRDGDGAEIDRIALPGFPTHLDARH